MPLTKRKVEPRHSPREGCGKPFSPLSKLTLSSSLPPPQTPHAILTNPQTAQVPQHPPVMPLSLTTNTDSSLSTDNPQRTQQKSLSRLLYLPERRVNKHGDLCHGHCQGLDDGHSLCPSKCHVCIRILTPPGATKGKGTCRCCVSCSQRNPTFLGHLAQSPGVGLHPAILLLQKEEKNQVSERNTQPAPPCTALHKPHTRSLGAAMLLEPSRRSKASSHQQQQFFCLSSQPRGFPNCSTAAVSLDSRAARDFYMHQNWLHMVGVLFAVPI